MGKEHTLKRAHLEELGQAAPGNTFLPSFGEFI